MRSLKKQLILLLAGLLTGVGVVAGAVSFYLALGETNGLLDHQLVEIARSVDEGSQLAAMQASFRSESREQRESDFVIQVWYHNLPVRSSRPDFVLPRRPVPGFSDVVGDGQKWRVYTLIHPDRTVEVSQDEAVRFQIATYSALRVLFPVALLIPLSWLLVGLAVSRLLRPLEAVTRATLGRDVTSRTPLPTAQLPEEAAPLVIAMNDLIFRLGEAIDQQRQFLSNAAHELRTPLAALRLQIENLARTHSREDLDARIAEMNRGSLRASRLVDQLLKAARYEAQGKPVVRCEVDLDILVKATIADFVPLAVHRGIDLGMVADDAVTLMGDPEELRILVGNLVDNAIRYTHSGGRVDVGVRAAAHGVAFEVVDTGPGIPAALLPRVFDRFFRAAGQDEEGSGIGLAIVKAIAERESAEVTLANREDGPGLRARVFFPFPG